MGSGLGWALREGGARVVTSLAGRSARTARLAEAAGLELLKDLDDVVRVSAYVLVVTPPDAALGVATDLAEACRRTHARPLITDLNAIAPPTATAIRAILEPLEFVDGSISGGPPNVSPGARLYFSGPRSAEVAALPWRHVNPIDLGGEIGRASALKMSTASVYKGLVALYAQAIRSAGAYDVLDPVLADLRASGYDMVTSVALAAAKSPRYVPEMREISAAQAGAGLNPDLFAAMAEIYAQIATTALAEADPESVTDDLSAAEVVARLRP